MTQAASDPTAAYIHVPFCLRRCGYCDFTLVAGRSDLVPEYLRALEIELCSLERPRAVDTLFLGGGTPTELEVEPLEQLLTILLGWFRLNDDYEFSVEANPDGLTREKLMVLLAAGVNRISLGVQSFDAADLITLERTHTDRDAIAATERASRYFENVALDLIFAVPGQTVERWRATLNRGIEFAPAHISTYGLTFEKGTSFWSRRQRDEVQAVEPETQRAMYALAMETLATGGFEQYEISNFARPGFRCRHNLTYWQARPYFGFGPGAARYDGTCRRTSHRSVTTWLKRVLTARDATFESEKLTPENRAREAIVLALRTSDGVRRNEFESRFGFRLDDLSADAIRRNVASGLVHDDGKTLRLSREGRFLADSVVVDFL